MKASVRPLTKGVLLIVIGFMVFSLSAIPVSFAQATQLKVIAPTGNIPVLTQFKVDINVIDINVPPLPDGLFSWQIKLYYNPAVLRFLNGTIPPGHVFDGKPSWPGGPFNSSDAGGTYILYSNSLQGGYPKFNGSGILCRIYFEAKNEGTSSLAFSRPLGGSGKTYLWSDFMVDIPFTPVEGSVTVVGTDPRLPSAISINVAPSSVLEGEDVIISGAINVTVNEGTPVYIQKDGLPFVTALTGAGSQFSYKWTTTEDDILLGRPTEWLVRASWGGDSNYKPATSETKTVQVNPVTTWIKITPKTQNVGDVTKYLPTEPFNVTVIVERVSNLSEWQVKITFNQTILEALDGLLPPNNIFGENHTSLAYVKNNAEGFVQASTRSSAGSFSGNGTFFQAQFRGIATFRTELRYEGKSNLNVDKAGTQLKNSTDGTIPYKVESPGSVITVLSKAPKRVSIITLAVPDPVDIDEGANITGRVTDLLIGRGVERAQVIIKIRYNITEPEERYAVYADNDGKYVYRWQPNQTGIYNLKVGWAGDDVWQSATSEGKNVTVSGIVLPKQAPIDVRLYVVGGIVGVAVIVAVAVVYRKKLRKPPV